MNTSIENVLSSINGQFSQVKAYDSSDPADPWKTYRPGASTNDLSNLDRTMGFWVNVNTPCTLTVYGTMPVISNINLKTGWNLVGYPSLLSNMADSVLPAEADIISVYDNGQPYLIRDEIDLSTVTMSNGNAYWVHVTADCVWNIS